MMPHAHRLGYLTDNGEASGKGCCADLRITDVRKVTLKPITDKTEKTKMANLPQNRNQVTYNSAVTNIYLERHKRKISNHYN